MKSFFLTSILSILVFTLQAQTLPSPEQNKAIHFITEFYKAYTQLDTFKQELKRMDHLSPQALEKWERLKCETEKDPLLRIKKVPEYLGSTINCLKMEDNWYNVKFQLNGKVTIIPIKVEDTQKEKEKKQKQKPSQKLQVFKIVDILPEWHGEKTGCSPLKKAPRIDHKTDALKFVTTFYNAYTSIYAEMSKDMNVRLLELQKKYCTPAFYTKLQKGQKNNGADKWKDAIIGTAYFDACWKESIQFTAVSETLIRVSYRRKVEGGEDAESPVKNIFVKVEKNKNGYQIADVINR